MAEPTNPPPEIIYGGTNGDQTIAGTEGDDSIQGGSGKDTIDAGLGADTIQGGADDDVIGADDPESGGQTLGESIMGRDGLVSGHDDTATQILQVIQGLSAGASYEFTIDLPAAPADAEELVILWRGEEIGRLGAEHRTEPGSHTFTIDGVAGNDGDQIEITGVEVGDIGTVALQKIIVSGSEDRAEGNSGDDSISGEGGNDLLVGDKVGNEWSFIDGRWQYDPDQLSINGDGADTDFDDTIDGGQGMDVLIGQGGDDVMRGMAGRDTINAGTGDDEVYGGRHNDLLNLEDGDDYGVGGQGADTVNAGKGDDVVYGDTVGENCIVCSNDDAQSMSQHAQGGAWAMTEDPETGSQMMTQVIETATNTNYDLEFELSANAATGSAGGRMEVMWNGEVVDTIDVTDGTFQKYQLSVKGTGGQDELSFRALPPESDTPTGPVIHTDHPIFYYDQEKEFGGETVDVAAFAPGQPKLYQVISGQLKVFDPVSEEYQDAGPVTGLDMNAIGYNTDDDMLYGLARSDGTDAMGNEVARNDVVAIDAKGNAYRVGESGTSSFVGDFDDDGNLWAFNNSLNSAVLIDVDNIGADGNPVTVKVDLPNDFFTGKIFDIAYNSDEDAFYAVEAPKSNGGNGAVHRIDLSEAANGGEPVIESIPIAGTLVDEIMKSGFPSGAFGAVFMDGDGNLYAGLNKGDHDLGDLAASGGIYQINMDWDQGVAHGELKSASQITNKNDGAVDPRSSDAFAEVDATADLLIRAPILTDSTSGNDNLRGDDGDDLIYGGGGGDKIFGGNDEDQLYGDEGNDKMRGDAGDDEMYGGLGKDRMFGGADNDEMEGGAGADVMFGGAGDDKIEGGDGDDQVFGNAGADDIDTGDGADKAVGGEGTDTINTGAGNDKAFGGNGADIVSGGDGADMVDGGNGADQLFGGDGADIVKGQVGDDVVKGGLGDDKVMGGDGADYVDGGEGNDKVVGGAGADTLSGGEGDDHMWGGAWSKDAATDVFVKGKGSGTDFIHDFETEHDVVDLSAYSLSFDDLQGAMTDVGWATQIELTGFSGETGDRIFIKSVDKDELSEDNFNL